MKRILVLILICMLFPALCSAKETAPFSFGQAFSDKPWEITADELVYDKVSDTYTGTGNVLVEKGGTRLSADRIEFKKKTMDLFAEGNVVLAAEEDILLGRRLLFNLKTETGTVYDASLFLQKNNFHIQGSKIIKTGKDSYRLESGSITSCGGEDPAWKITGRRLDVTIEGYGKVRHAAFWAKEIPILYTPYLIFPVKIKRQTGLLTPRFGVSDRLGFFYSQPFFWAISKEKDATFYFDHLSKRGEKVGIEFRYIKDETSKGVILFDGLYDRRTDDGTEEAQDKWGYADDSTPRPNSDRYWFRLKQDQKMPLGFTGRLDVDIVSDKDYLHEFSSGYNGFQETRRIFKDFFSREIDDETDSIRTNRFSMYRSWSRASLRMDILWEDNVVARRFGTEDTTVQHLPDIEFDMARQPLFSLPAFFDLSSNYAYLYREDGDRAHRIDLNPRLYHPFRAGLLSIEPSFGLRSTAYLMDRNVSSVPKRTSIRGMYDFSLVASAELYRIFGNDLKHTLVPEVSYLFRPRVDQSELPYFDSDDRISQADEITYSVTNLLFSKKENRQVARLKLEQKLYSNDLDNGRRFSEIKGEMEIRLKKEVSIDADALWTPYDTEFTRKNLSITYAGKTADLSFTHSYEQGVSESLVLELLLRLTDRFSVFGKHEQNLMSKESLYKNFGFIYRAGCWSVKAAYREEAEDRALEFLLTLSGLGDIGLDY